MLLIVALLLAAALGFWAGLRASAKPKAEPAAPKSHSHAALFRGVMSPAPGTAGWNIVAAMNGAGCLGRSASDEPVFVLCARDRVAADVVRHWADLAWRSGSKAAKVGEARELADRMERWRLARGGGKIPD